MHSTHGRKAAPGRIARRALAVLLVLILSVSACVSVSMANTVTAVVVDGEKTYTFPMNSTSLDEILARAHSQGLEQLGPLDKVERVENTTTVNILRGMPLWVTQAGTDESLTLTAYQGSTVQRTLEENNILLREADQVTPSRDTPVTAGMTVEIRRAVDVTVIDEGQQYKVSMVGGTAADAVAKAGITLEPGDSLNYGLKDPLFDKMRIRVNRMMHITVTADGETTSFEVSGGTVAEALEKCGIVLGENDRVNVGAHAALTDGMAITVSRVTLEDITENEVLDYVIHYVPDDTMEVDQSAVLTEGEEGERQVIYRVTYVDGQEESREEIASETLVEPVDAVVAYGTATPEQEEWESDSESPEIQTSTGLGNTFTDAGGNVVSYSQVMEGSCTAYYGDEHTATGGAAQYGVIAVNPNVIPYGTRVYIASPDGSLVYGYAVAGDTGSACMSGQILADLCYDTEQECVAFGRRSMMIYILD